MKKKEKYKIIYEDDQIIVVYKERDFFSVKTNDIKTAKNNLYFSLLKYAREKKENLFPIHRLDFETSGLIIFAKNKILTTRLREEFKNHNVIRLYEAVVREDINDESTHYVKQYLTEGSRVYENPNGKEAITLYKKINRINIGTAIKIQIITGRRNQIRLALKKDNLTLIGDKRIANDIDKRLYLNAYYLKFPEDIGLNKTEFFINPLWILDVSTTELQ